VRLYRAISEARVRRVSSVGSRPLAAQVKAARLRIAQSETGKELIAELSAFEVNYTPSGNLTVEVEGAQSPRRPRDRDGIGAVVGGR
jgi:hypothetical protein